MKALICVAGLPHAEATVQVGTAVANLKQASVTLLTVISSDGQRPSAEKMLAEARALIKKPDADLRVRQGVPATEILKESQEGKYGLIVIGAHVVQGFLDYFTRSVADAVTRQAPVSVLVVKAGKKELKRLLVCTGGQDVSRSVVAFGADLSQAAGADVCLLHVSVPVPAMYTGLRTMDETLAELLDSSTPIAEHLNWAAEWLRGQGVTTQVKLRQGIVSEEIVREAEEGSSDLIILGGRDERHFWDDLFLGKVVPQVLHTSPCSVLVVRS